MYANRRCASRQACRRDAIEHKAATSSHNHRGAGRPFDAVTKPAFQSDNRLTFSGHPRPRGRRRRARTLATTAHTLRDRRGHAWCGGRSARLAPVFHPQDLCYRIPQSDRAPKRRLPRIRHGQQGPGAGSARRSFCASSRMPHNAPSTQRPGLGRAVDAGDATTDPHRRTASRDVSQRLAGRSIGPRRGRGRGAR